MTPLKSMPSIITKNPSINLACFVATSFLSLAANTANAASCTADVTLAALVASAPLDALQKNTCTVTPDYVKLEVYQFGLCTEMPSNDDITKCDFILNSPAATTLTLGTSSTGVLSGASQAALKGSDYTHAFMVIGSKIFLKDSFQFSSDRKSSDGGEGAICFTNGNSNGFLTDSATDNGITCGDSDGSKDTEASYRYFGTSGTYSADVTNSQNTTNYYTLVQGLAGTSASVVATTDVNGSYIFMAQQMASSVNMASDSAGTLPTLNLAFKVTDAAKLTFYDGSNDGVNFCTDTEQPCVGNIEVNTIDLQISAK